MEFESSRVRSKFLGSPSFFLFFFRLEIRCFAIIGLLFSGPLPFVSNLGSTSGIDLFESFC